MQTLILSAFWYVAVVLEFSGVGADPRGVEPRWLLLAAAHLAWTQRPGPAVLAAGLCGLCQAVVDGRELAFGVAVVAVAGWLLSWVRRERRWSSGATYLVCVGVFTTAVVLALDGSQRLWNETAFPEPRRWLLAAGAQGAMTALWGGGLWCLGGVSAAVRRKLLPPLDWRPARS